MTYDPTRIYNEITYGNYKTEAEACVALDAAVNLSQCFCIEKEVEGNHIITLKAGEEVYKRFKIDRLLIPNERFINHGWTAGPIGVEVKKSGEKIGKPVCQILDYKSAVFTSVKVGYVRLLPVYILLFPMGHTRGDIACTLAQNQIGGLAHEKTQYSNYLVGRLGEKTLFRVNLDNGTIILDRTVFYVGRKNGSR